MNDAVASRPMLLDYIATQGYTDVRELEDGTIVGLGPLMFTTALYIDLDATGWGRRFCFEHRVDALRELGKLKTGDDIPSGYVARRGI